MKKLLLLLPLFTLFSCVNDDDEPNYNQNDIGYLQMVSQRTMYFDDGGLLRYTYQIKNNSKEYLDFRVQFKAIKDGKDTVTYTTYIKTAEPKVLNYYYQFYVAPKGNYKIISYEIKSVQ